MLGLISKEEFYCGKTLLVIGGGRMQEPAVRVAKALGLAVAVVDADPQAPGLVLADYPLHISTTDTAACIAAARRLHVDGVMTMASDRGSRTVAVVAEALGLPGISPQTATAATNKLMIHQVMDAHRLPAPRYAVCRSLDEAGPAMTRLGRPVVVKPPDSNSSLGISLVNSEEKLAQALVWAGRYSQSVDILLEEFIPGEMVSVEAIVVDGQPEVVAVISAEVTPPPYLGHTALTVPAVISKEQVDSAKRLTTQAIQAMGINFGPVNTDICLAPDGPRLIELTPRLGGSYINSHLIPLSLGVNLIQAVIDQSLGGAPDLTPRFQKGAAKRFLVLSPGRVKMVPALSDIAGSGLVEMGFFIKPGDVVPEFHSAAVAAGFVITQGESAQEAAMMAADICRQVADRIVIERETGL